MAHLWVAVAVLGLTVTTVFCQNATEFANPPPPPAQGTLLCLGMGNLKRNKSLILYCNSPLVSNMYMYTYM